MKVEDIIHSKAFRTLLQLAYFDKGNARLGLVKYAFIAPFLESYEAGITSLIIYGAISWIFGRMWYYRYRKTKENPMGVSLQEIEAEIGNQFNKFQQEMRAEYKTKSRR